MKPLILFLMASALCLHAGIASADAYKCVEKGKVTISSEPCPVGATSTAITSASMPDAEAVAAARADEDRLKQRVDAMTRTRLERDAAYAAEQKAKAEQAALEAQARRDDAEAAAAAAEPRHSAVYGWPVYYGQDGRRGQNLQYGNANSRSHSPSSPGSRPGNASKRPNIRSSGSVWIRNRQEAETRSGFTSHRSK
ncbi:MAG: DUF4124 domain-containing protein [Zoogloeaceae bacterium]|jgi:membrane protein involved in colicin uptake|nr:DUF4124 domain-containing protein [Zoogloeaceae bacterium]